MGGDHAEAAEGEGDEAARLRIVLASTRVSVVGTADAADVEVARDVADLLIAVSDERPAIVVYDAHSPALDVEFFARIARDFPSRVAILVRGDEDVRTRLYAAGVYRARCYTPSRDAPCDRDGSRLVLEASLVTERVLSRLENPATLPASVG